MARGKRCPECGSPMYAHDGRHEAQGTWVTYVCRNGTCPSARRSYAAKTEAFGSK
jgi:hypothetical protein